MAREKFTGSTEVLTVSDDTLQVLGRGALFGHDIAPAGDVGQNTSGGGADADFSEDAPKRPQTFEPFGGFLD